MDLETKMKTIVQLNEMSNNESLDIKTRMMAREQILALINEPTTTIYEKIKKDIEDIVENMKKLSEKKG